MTNKPKILIVEDDSLIVQIYTTRLELEGFKVICARDGEEGLAKFSKEQPDLVMLDLMIPKVSGVDLLKKIRATNKKVPVLVYTVLTDEDRIRAVKALGANEYFIKGDTHPRHLVEKIKSYFVK
jgi:DNA-binding response OmpR family regulator